MREVAASTRLVDPLRRVAQREEAGRGRSGHKERAKEDSVEIEAEAAEQQAPPAEPADATPEGESGLDIAA